MNITSRQLKAFLLTAQHQSFSRAAEQLFITQSGMSVLVRELEAQLGFRLFDRTTRRVTLTEFGVKFLPIAAAASSSSRLRSRSEEHTSELQSHSDLVCRLLLEKKKKPHNKPARQHRPAHHSATSDAAQS